MSFLSRLFGGQPASEQSKFEALRDDGVRAMQIHELPYAVKCFKAALGFKHDLQTVGYLAEAYLRMDNYEEALPLLKELAAADGDTLEVSLLLAQACGHVHDYNEERNVTAALLAEYPDEPRALYLAAEADQGLGEELPAMDHLNHCLTLRPDYQQARQLRARILCNTKQYADALADTDELLKRDEHNEVYHTLQAEALEALGRTDEAIAALTKAHELNPFYEQAVLALGRLLTQGSRLREALKLYDEAIEQQPDFRDTYLARAEVRSLLGDTTGAKADQEKALEITNESPVDTSNDFTDMTNQMNERLRDLNPYKF